MIQAQHLSYGFPDKPLYRDISFTLPAGCHCALIGSNGAGKTTLADLIRRPEDHLFDGKLSLEGVGRMGYVSQFASREKEQGVTVLDYLAEDFIQLQQATAAVCQEMETAEDLEPLLEAYQRLLDEGESMDGDNYEQNIQRQLRLAALEEKGALPLSKLSGGEYKLVQIIRQMLRRPGLLIMDEPDVFLDFENLGGLRELINGYQGTMLVITHSRFLLAHCFDRIWHLENGDLQEFTGRFSAYQFSLLQRKVQLQQASAADAAEIQRTEEMVIRLRKEATLVADPVKGRALKAKVSYLERLEARKIKAPFVAIQQPEITLPAIQPPGEEKLLTVDGYTLAFDKTLLENVSFSVREGEKVAIVGPNGTGKTSLLRDLWAAKDPAVRYSPQARVGFFSQLQEETLQEKETAYKAFYDLGFATPAQVEAHLKKYGFSPRDLDRPMGQLSGGEKNLLQLARLSVTQDNLLLLDEPSSHLDTYAQLALEEAMAAYQGAILMVTHDFYTVVNCADTILYADNGVLRPVRGRTFRKMVYKRYLSLDYLEWEAKKKDLETRIARLLQEGDWEQAETLCQELEEIVDRL